MSEANYAAPIIERFGDKEITFPRLVMEEYAEIEEKVRCANRDRVRRCAGEAKLAGKALYDELIASDSLDVVPSMVDFYLQSHAGAKYALRKSLAKAGKSDSEADDVIKGLEPLDAINMARALCGFVHRVRMEELVRPPLSAGGQ